MAKRFTDTNKYKKHFIRGLQGAYKLLWDYLYHDCDHAGIWIVDFEIAQIYIGMDMPINKDDAIKFFNSDEIRIIEIDGGSKWFIPSFIEFQYGVLCENNRAHNSVIVILKKYGLYDKGLVSPLQGGKDKDKDKVKVKDKKKVFIAPSFQEFLQYCQENNHKNIAERAFKGYEAGEWKDSQGKQIINWKQKLQHVWFKEENKDNATTQQSLFNNDPRGLME